MLNNKKLRNTLKIIKEVNLYKRFHDFAKEPGYLKKHFKAHQSSSAITTLHNVLSAFKHKQPSLDAAFINPIYSSEFYSKGVRNSNSYAPEVNVS